MERMTKRTLAGVADIDYPKSVYYEDGTKDAIAASAYRQKAIDRLAAYEDTLLDPETVVKARDILLDISGDIDHLRELVQAEKDGRLVVLPCKVGDTVWYITSALEICEAEVTGIWLNAYTNPQMWLEIKYYSKAIGNQEYKSRIDLMLGKTVFLTREKAETALDVREKE